MSSLLRYGMVCAVASASAALSAAGMIALVRPASAPLPLPLRAAQAEAPVLTRAVTTVASPAAVMKASDGHFWAKGVVNGQPVKFLVDTGATAVALTPQDARRLGFDLAQLNYGYRVVTAAGPARAAAVKLGAVTVAGARLENVDALVIESGLDSSLLGMTYLGRLSSFEATRDALFLQP